MLAHTPRFFSKNRDIIPSPSNLTWLYRADNSRVFCTLATFVLGRFRSMHYKELQAQHIVDHQKSSRLVSTTSDQDTAYMLAASCNHDVVMNIKPEFVRDYLIDTARTVERAGTDFYTKIPEFEHDVTLLPMCTISSLNFIPEGVALDNPLYVEPTPEAMSQYKPIYEAQLEFLELLFNENTRLSSEQRQNALNPIIEMNDAFYKKTLGAGNPYDMTPQQFTACSNHLMGKMVSGVPQYDPDMTLKEILHKDGDRLLMNVEEYKILLTAKNKFDLYDEERHIYGRSSYQYE